jgi:pimeloyl-ACP methyl ester carboxylesterase
MVLGIKWADKQRDVRALARGVGQAAAFAPTRWVPSIVGGPASLLPPYAKYSEYRRVVPGYATPLEVLRYWPDVLLPSVPLETPDWAPSLTRYFTFRPSTVERVPDQWGATTSFPDESWFFVNGILTNDDLARFNAAYLAHLFRRPVTVVQNATSGALFDLVECATGKAHITSTEAAKVALPPIHAALTDPSKTRVVLIAHSQGTIIAANVLQRLAESYAGKVPGPGSSREGLRQLEKHEIAKLEVYAFANCATEMRHIDLGEDGPVPHLESFANEWDLVARLGAIAPDAPSAEVEIDGPVYLRHGAKGHLLNEHYLIPVEVEQLRGQRPGGDGTSAPYQLVAGSGDPERDRVPRLYAYLNGGRPD